MGIILDIFLLIAGFLVIIKSADWLTTGAEGIAKYFNIPRVIIGLTVVGFATSAPEFAVSAVASAMSAGGIAVGNAIGSNLANLGLVLGIVALLRPIKFEDSTINEDLPVCVMAMAVFYFAVMDKSLSFTEGALFVLVQCGYYAFVVFRELKRRGPKKVSYNRGEEGFGRSAGIFLLGLAGVVLSARFAVVPASENIARALGISEIVIGMTVVAVGTSLPELVTAVVASNKGMGDLAAGTVIGSNIFNVFMVLGVSGMIQPLYVDFDTRFVTVPLVLALTVFTFIFAKSGKKMTRGEGGFLLAVYILYTSYLLLTAFA